MTLKGRRVAIVIAEGFHDHEFWYPYYRFREEGAEVAVAGPQVGVILGEGRNGKDGLPAEVEQTVESLSAADLAVLYLPGGIYGPLNLRAHEPTLELVRSVAGRDGIVAAICHGAWILVSAGVIEGRKVSCPRDMADDVNNAGGLWVEDSCVRDGNLITARYFGFLPEHFREILPAAAGDNT